ncbi:25S rRNA (cytosine-C(5))-methyltransferase NSUN5 isoform X3 [Ricinus communis]|uniref:25S rRNA (cytosine-C(5))-methyltransferase NSUN5 isoform X3 n=1 Tax=Ricinus communis TaxID=3988 RepID=UPI000772BE8D|nr:25S rRNA (cytosine-C(5))-methyltransferase NSUN5 isoform X3 [Ricinus communis]|eukprot:XP_015572976.1 probable 28S rRNA (cytosine-C(5))-methyltransferase isoform X3 [Ricinus communis]
MGKKKNMLYTKPPSGAAGKSETRQLTRPERSGFYARREAANVLKRVLQGHAQRRATGSIKSLVYSPSVRNKRATFALVCQTLKHLPVIKDVLESAGALNTHSKLQKKEELMYIVAYDILFGQEIPLVVGDVEKFLLRRKNDLQRALAKVLVRKKAKTIDDLLALYRPPDVSKPCYVRVNTLKSDVDSALLELGRQFTVQKDDMVPNLFVLPPNSDLHNHPLVLDGSIFVQGKASSMVAVALDPKPGWEIRAILLDPSCSGSGTAAQRLDHLLPSHATDPNNMERLKKLAAFQKKALAHALSFPAVERVVYSTCSINQTENEDVIISILPIAASHGFQLVTPFPQWHRRGLSVFEGSEHLLRTDPVEDKEGFFIALFVKKGTVDESGKLPKNVPVSLATEKYKLKRKSHVNRKKLLMPLLFNRVSKFWLLN